MRGEGGERWLHGRGRGGEGWIRLPVGLGELALYDAQSLLDAPPRVGELRLLLQDAPGYGLGSLGYVRSMHEGEHRWHRHATCPTLRQHNVTRPGIGRTVARQDVKLAILRVEQLHGAHL